MSANTSSNTQTPSNSSTGSVPVNPDPNYQVAPIVALLKRPLHTLSPEELRKYSAELRELATSPQALGRKLREAASEAKRKESKGVKDDRTLEDFMASLK